MNKMLLPALAAIIAFAAGVAVSDNKDSGATVALPAKISKEDMTGRIFERADTIEHTRGDNTVLDVTTLLSSDGKFASGMYKSGKSRFEIDEPYGVDEFMYFIEGGVTLTSADGSVLVINAGEAVTLPREWTGVWDTEGYTKIWVIYSEDGSGL
ncbi:MAG: cupin domain-containing protein [Woeseiaceae bacterium]|nr:cupin domain-containing protein [Woeseiaceae bacterium]